MASKKYVFSKYFWRGESQPFGKQSQSKYNLLIFFHNCFNYKIVCESIAWRYPCWYHVVALLSWYMLIDMPCSDIITLSSLSLFEGLCYRWDHFLRAFSVRSPRQVSVIRNFVLNGTCRNHKWWRDELFYLGKKPGELVYA